MGNSRFVIPRALQLGETPKRQQRLEAYRVQRLRATVALVFTCWLWCIASIYVSYHTPCIRLSLSSMYHSTALHPSISIAPISRILIVPIAPCLACL